MCYLWGAGVVARKRENNGDVRRISYVTFLVMLEGPNIVIWDCRDSASRLRGGYGPELY